jgi:hypothetical protein
MTSQPRIECEVTFLTQEEGGRSSANPPLLSENFYRPHLVVGDPSQRQAKITGRMMPVEYADGTRGEHWTDKYIDEEMLGVAFESGPDNPQVGKPLIVTLLLMYWPYPGYEKLQPAATFTVREGSKIVGFGRVLRRLA